MNENLPVFHRKRVSELGRPEASNFLSLYFPRFILAKLISVDFNSSGSLAFASRLRSSCVTIMAAFCVWMIEGEGEIYCIIKRGLQRTTKMKEARGDWDRNGGDSAVAGMNRRISVKEKTGTGKQEAENGADGIELSMKQAMRGERLD